MPSKDIILELLETVEKQGFKYSFVVIKPKSHSSDELELYTNINQSKSIQKLIMALKKVKIDKKPKKVLNKGKK